MRGVYLCFGGGFELALRADVIFVDKSARFGHPERTLSIVTLLGGVYRVAERAGRTRASEWALTSEQVPAKVMADAGVINRVMPDDDLFAAATAFARKAAKGPTRAYAAHKALLPAWAVGGVTAADEGLFDIAMPLFETDDVTTGLASAVNAFKSRTPAARHRLPGPLSPRARAAAACRGGRSAAGLGNLADLRCERRAGRGVARWFRRATRRRRSRRCGAGHRHARAPKGQPGRAGRQPWRAFNRGSFLFTT